MRLSVVLNEIRNTSPVSSQAPLSPVTPTTAPRLSFSRDVGNGNGDFGIRVVDDSPLGNRRPGQPLASLSSLGSRPPVLVEQSPEDSPRSSERSQTTPEAQAPSPAYSQSLYSEKAVLPGGAAPEKTKRRGCLGMVQKRILIIFGIVILVLLAGIIGLAVGLTKKHSSR
jgi:hypothetical protein